jgi:hypothetical protein
MSSVNAFEVAIATLFKRVSSFGFGAQGRDGCAHQWQRNAKRFYCRFQYMLSRTKLWCKTFLYDPRRAFTFGGGPPLRTAITSVRASPELSAARGY